MQIHTEAHLVWNINTSISEFAMKTVPPSTSYLSGFLFSCGQHRMESLGLNWLHSCAIKHHVWRRWISSGWDPKSNTAGECHLAPSSLWEAGCQLFQSDSLFYLSLFLFIYYLLFIYLFIYFCQKCQHLFGILTRGWYWICAFPPPAWLVTGLLSVQAQGCSFQNMVLSV